MAQIEVRAAVTDDVEEMAASAIAAWREGFRGLVPEYVDPRQAWAPERIAQRIEFDTGRGHRTLVAEVDGRVRGLVLLGPSRDRGGSRSEGEVIALYVHPDHWRIGVGRRLVEAALAGLREAGFEEAIVWTLAGSERNLRFYEALGFERDGGAQRRPSFGNPLEVRLRRSLAS